MAVKLVTETVKQQLAEPLATVSMSMVRQLVVLPRSEMAVKPEKVMVTEKLQIALLALQA